MLFSAVCNIVLILYFLVAHLSHQSHLVEMQSVWIVLFLLVLYAIAQKYSICWNSIPITATMQQSVEASKQE